MQLNEYVTRGVKGVDKWLSWEKKQLNLSPKDIWSLSLPEKVRRILLLIKLNLGTNPHIFVSGISLKNEGLSPIIQNLQNNGWNNIQASISTPFDDRVKRNPFLQISSNTNISDYDQLLNQCAEGFSHNFIQQQKLLFQNDFFSNLDQINEWFWGNSIFIFYPNRWIEENHTMIGGCFSIESRINTPRRDRDEVMKIEAAPLRMGGDVSQYGLSIPGYRYIGVGKQAFYLGYGLVTISSEKKDVVSLKSTEPFLEFTRDKAMNKLWNNLTRDPNYRYSLRCLQEILNNNVVIFDWFYHENRKWADSNKIVCIDFDSFSNQS